MPRTIALLSRGREILKTFQHFLPSGSVVEIGAGHGIDGKMLKDAGYDYLGTDAAAGMVSSARTRFPDVAYEQLNVYELSSLGRKFDGLWANAVLLHIPKARIDEALSAIADVLRIGGVCFISIKDGDGEEFEQRGVSGRQENRIFSYWSRSEFEAVLGSHGFRILDYAYHPKSERSKWHHFYASKTT